MSGHGAFALLLLPVQTEGEHKLRWKGWCPCRARYLPAATRGAAPKKTGIVDAARHQAGSRIRARCPLRPRCHRCCGRNDQLPRVATGQRGCCQRSSSRRCAAAEERACLFGPRSSLVWYASKCHQPGGPVIASPPKMSPRLFSAVDLHLHVEPGDRGRDTVAMRGLPMEAVRARSIPRRSGGSPPTAIAGGSPWQGMKGIRCATHHRSNEVLNTKMPYRRAWGPSRSLFTTVPARARWMVKGAFGGYHPRRAAVPPEQVSRLLLAAPIMLHPPARPACSSRTAPRSAAAVEVVAPRSRWLNRVCDLERQSFMPPKRLLRIACIHRAGRDFRRRCCPCCVSTLLRAMTITRRRSDIIIGSVRAREPGLSATLPQVEEGDMQVMRGVQRAELVGPSLAATPTLCALHRGIRSPPPQNTGPHNRRAR